MLAAPSNFSSALSHEIQAIVTSDVGWQDRLQHAVCVVANHMEVDVCSVYLLEQCRNRLVLRATVGLRQSCIDQLGMDLDVGLVGLVAERQASVAEKDAQQHPRFKYFSEADEDAYLSFLGVPLFSRGEVRGVLDVQTIERHRFSLDEIGLLERVGAQLAAILQRSP